MNETGVAGEVSIRQVERADLLAIVRIENATFPQPWPLEAFETFCREPGFLVAVDGAGAVVGYVVADVSPAFGRHVGHIKDFAVHPIRRGVGIGSALLERVLVVLEMAGATVVKLEVRASNERAKRLYRAFGFEPLRRVAGYYGDEDAIVMVRR